MFKGFYKSNAFLIIKLEFLDYFLLTELLITFYCELKADLVLSLLCYLFLFINIIILMQLNEKEDEIF